MGHLNIPRTCSHYSVIFLITFKCTTIKSCFVFLSSLNSMWTPPSLAAQLFRSSTNAELGQELWSIREEGPPWNARQQDENTMRLLGSLCSRANSGTQGPQRRGRHRLRYSRYCEGPHKSSYCQATTGMARVSQMRICLETYVLSSGTTREMRSFGKIVHYLLRVAFTAQLIGKERQIPLWFMQSFGCDGLGSNSSCLLQQSWYLDTFINLYDLQSLKR